MSESQYLSLLTDILENGVHRDDRTGVGTIGVFGRQMRFDLSDGFPLLTTKKVHFKSVVVELLWFLRGDTNTKYLHDHGVSIWDEWATPNGDLGPVYGKQWRSWLVPAMDDYGYYVDDVTIDQIANVLHSLKTNPNSRRHIVSAWNPADVDDMALPPCHCLFQFNTRLVDGKRYLDCQLYQRSADVFLGVPFNIASYALLTIMIADECGYVPGEFIHTLGDAHLYLNHLDQAKLQLTREPKPFPTLSSLVRPSIFDYEPDDFYLVGYDPHPAIKAPVAK